MIHPPGECAGNMSRRAAGRERALCGGERAVTPRLGAASFTASRCLVPAPLRVPLPDTPPTRPRVRLRVVAIALGVGLLAIWWPRLVPSRGTVAVATGVVELRSDAAVDGDLVRAARAAAERAQRAGLEIPAHQVVLHCQSRACWRANVPPRWARATTRLVDGLIVLSPWMPLGPLPDASQPAPWWRPAYWMLPASRHECAVRVLTHELAHVAHIRQQGRLQVWRGGADDAEAFASRVARATASPDSALAPYECAGAEGQAPTAFGVGAPDASSR